jgi:hypothetical protein
VADIFESNPIWAREWARRQQARLNRQNIPAQTGASTFAAADGTVPKVSGVSVSAQVQGLKVTWNDVNIRDLLRYDVQVANNTNFTGDADAADHATDDYAETFRVRDNDKLLPDLNPDVTNYRVRVRAVNTAGQSGAWSNVGSGSVSGAISSGDVTVGEITKIVIGSADTTWSTLHTNGANDTSDRLDVDGVLSTDTILLSASFEFDFSSAWGSSSTTNNLTVELQRASDGDTLVTIDTLRFDFKSTIPTAGGGTAKNILNAVFAGDQPGSADDYDYAIKLTTNIAGTGAALSVLVQTLTMQAQVIKA